MLSAKAQEIDKDTGLKMGANDYLTKPASPSEVVNRVEALLAQKTAARSKVIALLGSKRGAGTSTVVVNVAIALSQKGKRVTVVDFYRSDDGNITKHLGLKPEHAITELLLKPLDTIDRHNLETALATHPTGIRVLAIPQSSGENKEVSSLNADLLFEKLREVTEYILVDLPAGSSEPAKAILTRCDFIIIVTDSKLDGLPSVKATTALLSELGITQERVGAVIIDRDAIFPDVELSRMKSTIEASTGVSLLEIIPYDTKACLEPMYTSTPILLSDADCPMAWAIREVARHIIAQEEERVHR
jgi:MinD-like ATPase involved in chromosome partitioning or flagellar assembly